MKSQFTEVVSLEDVNNGAIGDLFNNEFKKLLNNLADENTNWKTGREINIKLKVKLNSETRDMASTFVEVSSKLAPPKPSEATVHLDTDGRNVMAFSRQEADQYELPNIIDIKEAK